MPRVGGLSIAIAMLVLGAASPAVAASRKDSPAVARRATEAQADDAEERPRASGLDLPGEVDLREKLIGLLPGPTLEEVARTLVERKVRVDISSGRAVVVVRLPLG